MGSDDNIDVDALEDLYKVLTQITLEDEELEELESQLYNKFDNDFATAMDEILYIPYNKNSQNTYDRYDKIKVLKKGLIKSYEKEGTNPDNAVSSAIDFLTKYIK